LKSDAFQPVSGCGAKKKARRLTSLIHVKAFSGLRYAPDVVGYVFAINKINSADV
jgi:hypothetical protein